MREKIMLEVTSPSYWNSCCEYCGEENELQKHYDIDKNCEVEICEDCQVNCQCDDCDNYSQNLIQCSDIKNKETRWICQHCATCFDDEYFELASRCQKELATNS